MITTRVRVLNGTRLRAWLAMAPAMLDEGLFRATEEGTEIMAASIRRDTPIGSDRDPHPGELLRSVQAHVERQFGGAVGTIESDTGYGPFVERGTRQHGEAHHMFERGADSAAPLVEGVFESHIAPLMGSFGNV